MAKKREKFETLGVITVDSGIVKLGDPCYDADDSKLISDVCRQGFSALPNDREGGNYDDCAAAIVVESGFGDGVYAVLGKRCLETGRIKEVKIKFF